MKRTLFAVLGLAIGLATACTTPPGAHITCATATYQEEVGVHTPPSSPPNPNTKLTLFQFDFTRVGTYFSTTYYHHLNYEGLTVKDMDRGSHARGLIPHSEPHYALSNQGVNGSSYITTTLSVYGTKTTTFDMNHLWFGCLSPTNTRSAYAAVACNVSVDCSSPLSFEGHLGPRSFTFTPSGPKHQQMILMDIGYTYCTDVTLGVYSEFVFDGTSDAILVIDSLNYTAREGEVILDYGDGP